MKKFISLLVFALTFNLFSTKVDAQIQMTGLKFIYGIENHLNSHVPIHYDGYLPITYRWTPITDNFVFTNKTYSTVSVTPTKTSGTIEFEYYALYRDGSVVNIFFSGTIGNSVVNPGCRCSCHYSENPIHDPSTCYCKPQVIDPGGPILAQ